MLHTLRKPKWIVAAVVIVILATVFVGLGIWQLDRLEQRRALNEMGASRLSEVSVELSLLIEEAGGDLGAIQYRPSHVSGVFRPEDEVLVRSQVELGQAGFHVVTPLVTDDGWAILVNRGWVPLNMDTPPVEALAPEGRQRIEGWIQLSQPRPALGREDPPGERVLSRVDIDRIGLELSYAVAPVYLVAMGESDAGLPVPVDPPTFDDEGSHLAYALQWFAFAAVALVGFYFLVRRKAQTSDAKSSTTS